MVDNAPEGPPAGDMSESDAEALALIAAAAAQHSTPPPSTLRARILTLAHERRLSYIARDAGLWLPVAAGIEAKELFLDSADRATTRLIRLAPSAALPARTLPGGRAVFLLHGGLTNNETRLVTGDFAEVNAPLAWHATGDGALLLEYGSVAPLVEGAVRQQDDARWTTLFPGARMRSLRGSHGAAEELFVLDMEPESVLGDHDHTGLEELFVLGGSCVVEGQTMVEGDYHRAAAGTHHQTTSTRTGCQLIVSVRDLSRLPA